uniref:Uncharacterized protein n=1 Tax=Ditylum brightwellii TaxID=49249 RepID=A0A6U3S517_9STRA
MTPLRYNLTLLMLVTSSIRTAAFTSVQTGVVAFHRANTLPSLNSRSSASPDDFDHEPSSSMQSPEDRLPLIDYNKLEGSLPLPNNDKSEERLARISREKRVQSLFLQGDDLIELRQNIQAMKMGVSEAKRDGDLTRVQKLEKAIQQAQVMDAEFAYAMAKDQMEFAESKGNTKEATAYRQEAMAARSCIPHFNIEGLWIGKYGEHGYEMINVTYAGDTLIATKVTGDENVPKGEISFTADLSPKLPSDEGSLEPIALTEAASKQWGIKNLMRYPGKGHVASKGFVNKQWMDGQIILVGEYFSFAWLPIGHQIFFGRPSAELTLKMLKKHKMAELSKPASHGDENVDDLAEMRAFAMRCMQETQLLEDEEYFHNDDRELFFASDDEKYYQQEGCFE